jgi:hypothetical protein
MTPTTEVHIQTFDREMLGRGELFALVPIAVSGAQSSSIHPDIHNMLQQYHDLLEEPKGIPPPRQFDHHISLKDGTTPVNVRPYRYAHF